MVSLCIIVRRGKIEKLSPDCLTPHSLAGRCSLNKKWSFQNRQIGKFRYNFFPHYLFSSKKEKEGQQKLWKNPNSGSGYWPYEELT